uniref:Uncharacterized protein n=1 Tax=Rhizophora mucronata TaxID=61149 RepID=A0A2P2R2Z5_RHIMU
MLSKSQETRFFLSIPLFSLPLACSSIC